MNTVNNQHLFRHRESNSSAFNNLCTLVHKLPEEGTYAGEVVQGKRLLGTFRLRCDAKNELSQVNIDLSTFDALFRANVAGLTASDTYAVGKDGYVVFYASAHHDGLYVKLTKVSKENGGSTFDSRRLDNVDIVTFRLWHAGSYRISNEHGGHEAALSVLNAEDGKFPELAKRGPVRVRLSDKGFDPAKMEIWPTQPLVISVEVPAALRLQSNDSVLAKHSGPVTRGGQHLHK